MTPADSTLATTVIDPVSDLRANKTQELAAGGDPRGQAFYYSLSTTNLGPTPFPASGTLTLTDNLPAGLQVNSIVPPAGFTCTPTAAFRWTVRPPSPAPAPTSRSRSTRRRPRSRSNAQATVTGADAHQPHVREQRQRAVDTNPPNNCIGVGLTAQPPAQQADVSMLKRVIGLGDQRGNRQLAGEPIVWEIEVVNAGPDVATGVLVTDVLQQRVQRDAGATTAYS